jgi:DNA modification methylase
LHGLTAVPTGKAQGGLVAAAKLGFACAEVAELADALDSKSSVLRDVRVRVPPSALRAAATERQAGKVRSALLHTLAAVAGKTQEALYAEIDLELSWSEDALPQVERTKHVHSLHPYLGKFIPQLVEVFLHRYFRPGQCVYDPFVGSGTTLVEANAFGAASVGCDISAFNCLLARVKTTRYSLGALELALKGVLEQSRYASEVVETKEASDWLRAWYSKRALSELLAYDCVASESLDDPSWDAARVILSRAARSARRTTHFDLDFPRHPVTEPYWCQKHKRTCRPVDEAMQFLRRYTTDTVRRIREFALAQTDQPVEVIHGDARLVDLPREPSGIITSPPYPGLIDYHEQHRYSYELLGLKDRREDEIGPASRGNSHRAVRAYVRDMIAVFANAHRRLPTGAPVVIVVNDSRDLYAEILEEAELRLEAKLTRHVNRRTGRRAGEFFENVLVCATA